MRKIIAIVLVVAGCSSGEGEYQTLSGKRLATLNFTDIELTDSRLSLPPEITVAGIKSQAMSDRYVEFLSLMDGAVKYEALIDGGFERQLSPNQFRAVLANWKYGEQPIPNDSLKPYTDYPLTRADFTMRGKDCIAFARTVGKPVYPQYREAIVYGFLCGDNAPEIAKKISLKR